MSETEVSYVENSAKYYVRVCTLFDLNGKMIPQYLLWEDGQKYTIDRVLDVKPAPARKAGGYGDRYTVRIRGQERYLFFEHSLAADAAAPGKWFVEKP